MFRQILVVCVVCFAFSPAWAQRADDMATPRSAPRLTGNPVRDIKTAIVNRAADGEGDNDLLGALDAKLLPDLKYALNLANKANSKITGPCYAAWIEIIEARQSANLDDQGNPVTPPDPGLITKFEKLVELRNTLQPDSEFMLKCSPVASMVRSDIRKFIGMVLTGGVGLASLGLGL